MNADLRTLSQYMQWNFNQGPNIIKDRTKVSIQYIGNKQIRTSGCLNFIKCTQTQKDWKIDFTRYRTNPNTETFWGSRNS